MDIHLNQSDKNSLVAPEEKSHFNAKQLWYKYRNCSIQKAEELEEHTTAGILRAILVVLVKIYWELRKPKK